MHPVLDVVLNPVLDLVLDPVLDPIRDPLLDPVLGPVLDPRRAEGPTTAARLPPPPVRFEGSPPNFTRTWQEYFAT